MTPVREGQVEDLVTVFFQCLNLHTGDTVKQTPELSVPGHGRCTKTQQELIKSSISLSVHTAVTGVFCKEKLSSFVSQTRDWDSLPGCRGTERGIR